MKKYEQQHSHVAHTPRCSGLLIRPVRPFRCSVADASDFGLRLAIFRGENERVANSLVLLQAPCTVVDFRGRSEWKTRVERVDAADLKPNQNKYLNKININ